MKHTILSPRSMFLFLMIFFFHLNLSAKVDTVVTYSQSMSKEIKAVIITPKAYDNAQSYPVVYLLHGYSGNEKDWIDKVPAIEKYADQYNLLIVCPDGNFNSWYWDSPENDSIKYETYVAAELVEWVDEHYSTVASSKGRAITGLSMGGHGALYLAFRHQDVFGAAGSMSGGVDIVPFTENWGMKESLGTRPEYPDRWEEYSVMGQLHLLTPKGLALIIECGTEDFFYPVNVRLHEELLYNRIPHTFITGPGGHTWDFWENAVKYQLLFFNDFFIRQIGRTADQ